MSFWTDYNCNRYDPDSHENRIVCDSEYVTEKELSDAKDIIIETTKEYADEYTVDQAKEHAEALQTAFENEFNERADTFEDGIDTRVTAVENAETVHEATVSAELSGFESRVTATESVAGTASTDAANAVATANLAYATADSASILATEAKNTADVASARLDTAIDAVTTDTEVTDIRVGADGKTYDTAGNAVRKQIGKIEGRLKNNFGDNFISFDSYSYTADSTASWKGKFYTSFIPTGNKSSVTIKADASHTIGAQLFTISAYDDENKTNRLGRKDVTSLQFNTNNLLTYSLPDGTNYVELSGYLISNKQASETIVVGETYYITNFYVYFDNGATLSTDVTLSEDNFKSFYGNADISSVYDIETSWKNRVEDIKSAQKDNFIFAIQTDTHFDSRNIPTNPNLKIRFDNSMRNLSKLTEYIGFNFIANLGDIIHGGIDTKADTRKDYTEIFKRYSENLKCPLLVTLGNHDFNHDYADSISDMTALLDQHEVYGRTMPFVKNSTNNAVFNDLSNYYYVDYKEHNIRVIVLNSTDGDYTSGSTTINNKFMYSNEQMDWFENTALDTDKSVIVMSHTPWVTSLSANATASLAVALTKLKAFKNNGGTVIGVMFGHTHEQNAITEDGIPMITFTNGAYCAEVVIVDTNAQTIKTYGLGSDSQAHSLEDRSFTYE